jgi:hypothetical protein
LRTFPLQIAAGFCAFRQRDPDERKRIPTLLLSSVRIGFTRRSFAAVVALPFVKK